MDYTLNTLPQMLCLDCVAGSTAQGLATATSDVDRKGVFLAPLPELLAGRAAPFITDERHDLYYEEIGTFCAQILANNPASLEVLYSMEEEQELFCAPWFRDFFAGRQILSKRCCGSYVRNAHAQLKRVRATHQKATQAPPQRRTEVSFAHVLTERSSEPLTEWLAAHAPNTPYTLRPLTGLRNLYALEFNGEVCAHVWVDQAAMAAHNRAVAEYEEWKQKRNAARFAGSGTEQYDTKHMGHIFRLLHCAAEIASEGVLYVRRTHDAEFLRAVRRGEFSLAELLERADEEIARVTALFERSSLPDTPALEEERLPLDLAELRIQLHHRQPR